MSFYRFTLLGMLIVLVAACCVCWSLAGWAQRVSREVKTREIEYLSLAGRAVQREQELEKKGRSMSGMHAFLKAWEPHQLRISQDKDISAVMRMTLETLAQRKLSLVTDQVTAPEPGQVMFGKKSVTVQRVSMRASGENLVSLITWLGEAEASFPLARVEAWELSAGGGPGLSIKLMLAQPIQPFSSSQASR